MENVLLTGDIPMMAGIFRRLVEGEKMTAPGISTDRIDQLYDVTFVNGVPAGTVSRAGGGFVAFLRPPKARLGFLCAPGTAGGSVEAKKFFERGCGP